MEKIFKLDTEKNTLTVRGTLTKLTYGRYIKGKKPDGSLRLSDEVCFQISIRANVTKEEKESVYKQYYSDSESQFIPSWIKEDSDDVFMNFRSIYGIYYFIDVDGTGEFERLSYDELKEKYGLLVGSTVTLNIACKDGALYVRAVRFDSIKAIGVSSYF